MADLDAKRPRGIEAKTFTRKMYYCALLSKGEKEVVNELERILQPQERGWQKFLKYFTPLSRISNAHWCSRRTATCLVFAPRSQSSAKVTGSQFAPSARYPDSLRSVRPQIRSSLGEVVSVHSPLTTHHSLKKAAFTLAEVLITLGIIGVVAALTIPSLIQKYQEKELVVSYKRVYSLLNQAYDMLIPEYGTYDTWEKTDIDNYNKFKSKLKISVDCPPNKSSEPCITMDNINYVDFGGKSIDTLIYESNFQPAVRLVTGESIIFWTKWNLVTFVVDLNGKSAPNKLGVDLHFFSFNSRNGKWDKILPGPTWSVNNKQEGDASAMVCQRNASYDWFLGCTCGYWILQHDNMDYVHLTDKEIVEKW